MFRNKFKISLTLWFTRIDWLKSAINGPTATINQRLQYEQLLPFGYCQ